MNFDRWVERIYSENDPGRGVATTVAGAMATAIYLYSSDWAVAALVGVTIFPVAKIAASGFHANWTRKRRRSEDHAEFGELLDRLGYQERLVVQHFVWHGASVMTWGECNTYDLSRSAINSLIERGLAKEAEEAQGVAIDTRFFDYAQTTLEAHPF